MKGEAKRFTSVDEMLEDFAESDRKEKAARPIRFFFNDTLRYGFYRWWRTLVHDPWYWLKCRIWHRYNVVYVKTLPPTWVDRDELLLHAAFQILDDFVKKERPFEWFDTEDSQHAKEWIELDKLHVWWTSVRPNRPDSTAHIGNRKGTDEEYKLAWKIEDECETEDQENLHRLVNIRKMMWT